MRRTGGHRQGFTLAEGLLASTVLAVAAGAMLLPFTVGARNNTVVVRQAVAVSLAEALLEEILVKPFYDPDGPSNPGPEPGESGRDRFDNIDDYHDYTEAAGQLCDTTGSPITGASLAGYSRHATVNYLRLPGDPDDEDPTVVRVTVEVRRNGALVHRLSRLVGRRNESPAGATP